MMFRRGKLHGAAVCFRNAGRQVHAWGTSQTGLRCCERGGRSRGAAGRRRVGTTTRCTANPVWGWLLLCEAVALPASIRSVEAQGTAEKVHPYPTREGRPALH